VEKLTRSEVRKAMKTATSSGRPTAFHRDQAGDVRQHIGAVSSFTGVAITAGKMTGRVTLVNEPDEHPPGKTVTR
jgi:hypothetical protein